MEENKKSNSKNLISDMQSEKTKVIPSYEKKTNKSQTIKLKSKITIILIVFILLVIISLIGYNIFITNKYKKYNSYNEKMHIYGFDKMYDNGSIKVTEKVTKSEAVKTVISTVYNLYDISSFAPIQESTYENEIWVKYAKDKNILNNEIDNKNQDDRISYIDVIMLLSKAKTELLGNELDIEGMPNFNDYEKYTNDEQIALKDMVWNKIIDNNTEKLNGKRKIAKGELNELLIRFAEKYRTFTLNSDDKLVINEEKLPYNYEEYPYVLANINKKVYEIKLYNSNNSNSKTPIQLYADEKQNFEDIKAIIMQYFGTILNVNYETITLEQFKSKINSISMDEFTDEQIQDYIDYVKKNKIKLSGSATVQFPIVYYDGENIRVRIAIECNVLNGNTLENVLFSDKLTGNIYKYNNKNEVMYVDVPFVKDEATGNLYINIGSVNKNIAGNIIK